MFDPRLLWVLGVQRRSQSTMKELLGHRNYDHRFSVDRLMVARLPKNRVRLYFYSSEAGADVGTGLELPEGVARILAGVLMLVSTYVV